MSDLIGAVIHIKNVFSLVAFLGVVLLLAFRTKAVPELFFGLLREKLTRERFSQLLHRGLLFGFILFIGVVCVAVVGEVLAYASQPKEASLAEFKDEVLGVKADVEAQQKAIDSYQQGLGLVQQNKFDEAIKSIENSLAQVPTLSAQATLAYLYKQTGKDAYAAKYARDASRTARQRGDSLALVKAERLETAMAAPTSKTEGGGPRTVSTLLGDETELPKGEANIKKAIKAKPLQPGLYVFTKNFDSSRPYYRVSLRANQTIQLIFRTAERGSGQIGAVIYDQDAVRVAGEHTYGPSAKLTVAYKSSIACDCYLNFWGDLVDSVVRLTIG